MNQVRLSGVLRGNSELRVLESSGRQLLSFDMRVDGERGRDPIVHCAFFPDGNDLLQIADGTRVTVSGALRHRSDESRLFIAAHTVVLEKARRSQAPVTLDRATQ